MLLPDPEQGERILPLCDCDYLQHGIPARSLEAQGQSVSPPVVLFPVKIIQLVKNPSPSKTSCVCSLSCLAIQFMDQVGINALSQWRHPREQGCEGKGGKSLQQERGECVVNQSNGGRVNQTQVLGCSRSKEREKLPPTLSQPESRRDFSLFGEL